MAKKKKVEKSLKNYDYLYDRMINFFMTTFFIFLLMVFFLLLIALSREVLSDSTVEQHLITTQNLLTELEKFDDEQNNVLNNYSNNFSNYLKTSFFNRIEIEDISQIYNSRFNISYVTFKSSNNFESFSDSIIITDIDHQLYDEVIFISEYETIRSGLIVEYLKEDELIILENINNTEMGRLSIIEGSQIQGVILN